MKWQDMETVWQRCYLSIQIEKWISDRQRNRKTQRELLPAACIARRNQSLPVVILLYFMILMFIHFYKCAERANNVICSKLCGVYI